MKSNCLSNFQMQHALHNLFMCLSFKGNMRSLCKDNNSNNVATLCTSFCINSVQFLSAMSKKDTLLSPPFIKFMESLGNSVATT